MAIPRGTRGGPGRTRFSRRAGAGSRARPSTTSTAGCAVRSVGGPTTLQLRLPPPSTMRCAPRRARPPRRAGPSGRPRAVTPPIIMPVIACVWSGSANDAFLAPSRRPHRPVDVEPGVGQHDAGGEARRIALADDDDRVGRLLRAVAVGGAEGGGVGQRGVARHDLVLDAEPRRDGRGPSPPPASVITAEANRGCPRAADHTSQLVAPVGSASARRSRANGPIVGDVGAGGQRGEHPAEPRRELEAVRGAEGDEDVGMRRGRASSTKSRSGVRCRGTSS